MKNWNQVELVPEFNEQGVACYKLAGGNYVNEYYVVSEAETRKLLNTPEIVGYEVYNRIGAMAQPGLLPDSFHISDALLF